MKRRPVNLVYQYALPCCSLCYRNSPSDLAWLPVEFVTDAQKERAQSLYERVYAIGLGDGRDELFERDT